MLNLIIYLNNQSDAKTLIKNLLAQKLIANASIDVNNEIYRLEGDDLVTSKIIVVTAQTKSMLFSLVEKYISETYGKDIPIYSMPITQANHSFDLLIRSTTLDV